MLLCKCCCLLSAIRCIKFLSPLVDHFTTWSTWCSSVCLLVLTFTLLSPRYTCLRVSLDQWMLLTTMYWIMDYLTERQQRVHHLSSVSDMQLKSTDHQDNGVPGAWTINISGHSLLHLQYTSVVKTTEKDLTEQWKKMLSKSLYWVSFRSLNRG